MNNTPSQAAVSCCRCCTPGVMRPSENAALLTNALRTHKYNREFASRTGALTGTCARAYEFMRMQLGTAKSKAAAEAKAADEERDTAEARAKTLPLMVTTTSKLLPQNKTQIRDIIENVKGCGGKKWEC